MPDYEEDFLIHPDAYLFPHIAALGVATGAGGTDLQLASVLDQWAWTLMAGGSRFCRSIARSILIGECERRFYHLHACAVMPNHVHLLILPLVPVAVMMRWLKGSTARGANLILGRTGRPFWQDESYDHWVRGAEDEARIVRYMEDNPVVVVRLFSGDQ